MLDAMKKSAGVALEVNPKVDIIQSPTQKCTNILQKFKINY